MACGEICATFALSLDCYIPFSCVVSEKCIKETINAVGIGVIIDIIGIRNICASEMLLMLMYIIMFSETMFSLCFRCLNSVLEDSVLNQF